MSERAKRVQRGFCLCSPTSRSLSLSLTTHHPLPGLLRICNRFADKPALFSNLVQLYRLLIPPKCDNAVTSSLASQIAESLWRLCSSHVSSLAKADTACWNTIFDVLSCLVETETDAVEISVFEISVKAFRSIFLLLNAAELKDAVPYTIVQPMNAVLQVVAGVDGRLDDPEQEGDAEETWEFRCARAKRVQ